MIKQLPKEIISKIAAGEVITSPTNIIKEIIENSIDANSSEIKIEIFNKKATIIITDNGDGILKEDLQNLCKRHFTSKYNGSLSEIPTFGFRGEALASISLCSKIIVQSKRDKSEIGYEVEYSDCIMKKIKPKAMNKGTRIEIRDIFYNNIYRREYFIGKREETANIFYLVANFSIRYIDTLFKLFFEDTLKQEIIHNTEKVKSSSELFSLKRKVFDDYISQKILINTIYKTGEHLISSRNEKIKLIISDVSYNYRKYIFVLFINGRLVDHRIIKEKIKLIYKDLLPKHKFPFVYIEINIPFSEVDINIHPSKKEVIFYEEEFFIELVLKEVQKLLENNNRPSIYKNNEKLNSNNAKITINPQIIYNDPNSSSLFEIYEKNENIILNRKRKIYKLKSIDNLKSNYDEIDSEFLKNLVYVGEFNNDVLVQDGPSLMICNFKNFKKEYFKQRLIFTLGNFDVVSCDFECQKKLTETHKSILTKYFNFKFDDYKIKEIPIIDKTSIISTQINDFLIAFGDEKLVDEEKTFEFIIDSLTKCLIVNIKESTIVFNTMKRNAMGTENILKCFKQLTSLNELYKMFERC